MRTDRVPIMTNLSMATGQTSIGMDVSQYAIGAIQAEWTGSPVGTLELQISTDIVPISTTTDIPIGPNPAGNVVNWSVYTASIQSVSGPGNFLWNMNFLGFRWVQLVWIPTSGTGIINATFCGKGG